MKKIKGGRGGTITPCEKGERIPGAGKPKGSLSFKTIAEKYLSALSEGRDPFKDEAVTVTGKTKLFFRLIHLAMNAENEGASIAAIREILDRLEGKVTQSVEHSGDLYNQKLVVGVVNIDAPIFDNEQAALEAAEKEGRE
jgi:hypothetical protein